MTRPPQTLVCFAVKEEAAHFKRLAAKSPEVAVLLTGMGRQNALAALGLALSNERPDRVITCGFAGGLVPELATGTVVFEADSASGLEPALRLAGGRPAQFFCADRIVTTVAQKQDLQVRTGAEAVEMESQFIRVMCTERGIPAATVRVILDTATEDLPLDFNQIMTPDWRIHTGKLTMMLLKSPMKIAALLRLQKQSSAAAKRLGEVLARVLLVG